MQVDPIKPMLKAPGPECLNLKCDETLSKFAFNFKLRRYNESSMLDLPLCAALLDAVRAGAYTRPLLSST